MKFYKGMKHKKRGIQPRRKDWKNCCKCGKWLHYTKFYKRGLRGTQSMCKICRRWDERRRTKERFLREFPNIALSQCRLGVNYRYLRRLPEGFKLPNLPNWLTS